MTRRVHSRAASKLRRPFNSRTEVNRSRRKPRSNSSTPADSCYFLRAARQLGLGLNSWDRANATRTWQRIAACLRARSGKRVGRARLLHVSASSMAGEHRDMQTIGGTCAGNEDIDGFSHHCYSLKGSVGAGCRANGRFVASDIYAKADGDTIPRIDRNDCQRQIDQLRF